MFQFPRCPPRMRGVPASPGTGCPIRKSLDHQLPALPQSVSPRGRVLPRPLAPRHPPCAHHRRVWSPNGDPAKTDGLGTGVSVLRLRSPAGGASWCARRRPSGQSPCARAPRGATPLVLSRYRASGAAGSRTPGLRRAKAALSQLSYGPHPPRPRGSAVVGAPGLEPGTSALSGPRSNHLSYAPTRPSDVGAPKTKQNYKASAACTRVRRGRLRGTAPAGAGVCHALHCRGDAAAGPHTPRVRADPPLGLHPTSLTTRDLDHGSRPDGPIGPHDDCRGGDRARVAP
jgi:hypothetical protein